MSYEHEHVTESMHLRQLRDVLRKVSAAAERDQTLLQQAEQELEMKDEQLRELAKVVKSLRNELRAEREHRRPMSVLQFCDPMHN